LRNAENTTSCRGAKNKKDMDLKRFRLYHNPGSNVENTVVFRLI
jgi:hypothetical protein